MYKWYLPTLSEIIALSESGQQAQGNPLRFPTEQRVRAEREWRGAIAALNQLLQQVIEHHSVEQSGKQLVEQTVEQSEVNISSSASSSIKGVVLSGPAPVLDQADLIDNIATWTFTVGSSKEMLQLLPAAGKEAIAPWATTPTLPLLPSDPLAAEQFCLVLTAEFSIVMVLGETATGDPAFLFSFEPEVVWQVWRSLQARLKLAAPQVLPPLDRLVAQFTPVAPDYRTVTQFSRLMLSRLPEPLEWESRRVNYSGSHSLQGAAMALSTIHVSETETDSSDVAMAQTAQPDSGQPDSGQPDSRQRTGTAGKQTQPKATPVKAAQLNNQLNHSAGNLRGTTKPGIKEQEQDRSAEKFASVEASYDTELLQAIAHEVRTPLTTIRTLARLLLKRKELSPDVIKRLEIIDRECTEQIDRFSLIFRAVELETTNTKHPLTPLAPISLAQVIQQNVSRWQQQVTQHGHTLDVILPQKLPMVVTDPTMLNQALTGLIDRITHSLPPGSHIQVRVALAGHQLKLQFESQPQGCHTEVTANDESKAKFGFTPALKAIGQLLMFQPETGNLSLNITVTKNLFQALGGKLIVRQRPQQGEVLTIFLPLETRKGDE